jgi:acetolactate synthase regulatory subunit
VRSTASTGFEVVELIEDQVEFTQDLLERVLIVVVRLRGRASCAVVYQDQASDEDHPPDST